MQSQEKQALEYIVTIALVCLIVIIAFLLLASPTLHALSCLVLVSCGCP